jgi:hypothetical protein
MTQKIARINGIALDCVTGEIPEYPSEVSSYPLEEGEDVSDHVHNLPLSLSIEAVVSAAPGALSSERGSDPLVEVRAQLEELRERRIPFKYEGLFRTYESMVFLALSFPRDTPEDKLRIAATMQAVESVELVRVAARLRPSPKAEGKPVWLCPTISSTGVFLGLAGSRAVTPGNDAAENARAGCRRVVRRNGTWVFADGKALTQEELTEVGKQNKFADSGNVLLRNSKRKESTRPGVPISSLPTYSPGASAIKEMGKAPPKYVLPSIGDEKLSF